MAGKLLFYHINLWILRATVGAGLQAQKTSCINPEGGHFMPPSGKRGDGAPASLFLMQP